MLRARREKGWGAEALSDAEGAEGGEKGWGAGALSDAEATEGGERGLEH
jgi:hypothetical protein